jgi:uncharacterized protein (TIGR04255 family)
MDSSATLPKILDVPQAAAAHYSKNFVRQVVCELRFPTLFELEGSRPPPSFALALRKEYPHYDLVKNLNLTATGIAHGQGHQFRSKNLAWNVTLRAAAISIETSSYDSFEDLSSRILLIIKAASKVIDSDFFTRVGLRYINCLACDGDNVDGWINQELITPLVAGRFGDVMEYSNRVAGASKDGGGYLFQHGYGLNASTGKSEYVLDFDFYHDNVIVSDTIDILNKLHSQEFSMFSWAIGDKAKNYLGPSTLLKAGE